MNEIERLKSIDVNGAIKKALVEQEKSKSLDELGQLREARIPVWMGRAKEWIFVASVADLLELTKMLYEKEEVTTNDTLS